jgi:hypothetical protein
MKRLRISRVLLNGIMPLAAWILVGSLALVGTSPAVAAATTAATRPAGASRPAGGPPSPLLINTGAPDHRMAMASRPANGPTVEIEAADDFSVTTHVQVVFATITGLLPTGAPLSTIQNVDLEMYRIFPLDSNTGRTITVPTRVNSPSDVDFGERSASAGQLVFSAVELTSTFHVTNSVLNGIHPLPNQTTGGEGPVTGEEVQINITLTAPFQLDAGHYFFIPKVQLSSGNWFWLSAAGPAQFPGDLQAWIRNSALDPDWLRVGTDIVGGGNKFNGSFSLSTGQELYLPLVLR